MTIKCPNCGARLGKSIAGKVLSASRSQTDRQAAVKAMSRANRKLTPSQVVEIAVARGRLTADELSQKYGVSARTVYRIWEQIDRR